MRSAWLRWWTGVLDVFFPPVCAICDEVQEGGRMLCEGCRGGLPRLEAPFCSRCGEHFDGRIDDGFECPNCERLEFSFEFARPAMRLDERTRELVHRVKYGRQIYLADELGKLAAEALSDVRLADAVEGGWPLVPVPLHWRRRAWRYFNQAEEIARSMGRVGGLPVLHALSRKRMTGAQTRLSRHQRLKNLRGAFGLTRKGAGWENKEGAILVDDVLTTGATVNECAKALRKGGFRRVVVVTVMRG